MTALFDCMLRRSGQSMQLPQPQLSLRNVCNNQLSSDYPRMSLPLPPLREALAARFCHNPVANSVLPSV